MVSDTDSLEMRVSSRGMSSEASLLGSPVLCLLLVSPHGLSFVCI